MDLLNDPHHVEITSADLTGLACAVEWIESCSLANYQSESVGLSSVVANSDFANLGAEARQEAIRITEGEDTIVVYVGPRIHRVYHQLGN